MKDIQITPWMLGQDGQDKLQTKSLLPAGQDPPASSRPGPEALTALAPCLMELATPRRCATTREGLVTAVIGP